MISIIVGASLISSFWIAALLYRRLGVVKSRASDYVAALDESVGSNQDGQPGLSPSLLLKLSRLDGDTSVMGNDISAMIAWSEDRQRLLASGARQPGEPAIVSLSLEGEGYDFIDGVFAATSPANDAIAVYSKDSWLRLYNEGGRWTDIAQLPKPGRFLKIPIPVFPSQLAWSPDGNRLAFTYRQTSWLGLPKGALIGIYNVGTSRTEIIAKLDRGVSAISWFADGNQIVFAQGSDTQLNAEVSILNITNGTAAPLIPEERTPAYVLSSAAAPSEDIVAYHHDPIQRPPFIHGLEITFVNVATGKVECAETPFIAKPYQQAQWGAQSSRLFFLCKRGALVDRICAIDPVSLITQEFGFSPTEEIKAFAISPDEKRLALSVSDPFAGHCIRIFDMDKGTSESLFESRPDSLRNVALSSLQAISWIAPDGLQLEGLLIPPINYQPGTRYPLIVDVHGGPFGGIGLSGAVLNAGPLEWQMWAAKGYAVLVADYRSSGVYGIEYVLAGNHNSYDLNQDAQDIIAGVQRVVEMGIADPQRLAVIGHSHGSLLVNWLITRHHPFSVAVSKEGLADLVEHYRRCPDRFRKQLLEVYGAPANDPEPLLRAYSPITYAENIRIPLLLVSTGRGSGRKQFDRFAAVIRQMSGEVEHVHYPDEPHVMLAPNNQKDVLSITIDWISRVFQTHNREVS